MCEEMEDLECYSEEETREYAGSCPECDGRGYISAGWGDTRAYTCPNCGGSGEIWECKECGKECGDYCEDCFAECRHCHGIYKSDVVHDGYCPACEWAKEENERKEAVNA